MYACCSKSFFGCNNTAMRNGRDSNTNLPRYEFCKGEATYFAGSVKRT